MSMTVNLHIDRDSAIGADRADGPPEVWWVAVGSTDTNVAIFCDTGAQAQALAEALIAVRGD